MTMTMIVLTATLGALGYGTWRRLRKWPLVVPSKYDSIGVVRPRNR